MANEVEQHLIDAQRALRERGQLHRSTITDAMTRQEQALVIYTDRMNEIMVARHKLDEEAHKAFETFMAALREQASTLILVRDMHPVLVDESEQPKQIANGKKKP